MVRVLIVEDSLLQRTLLKALLEQDPEIQVVGMATNGAEAVRMAHVLKPNLITMDIHMPVMDGLEATRQIMQDQPTPIVILSSAVNAADHGLTFSAIKAGAVEVVEKPANIQEGNFDEIRHRLMATVKGMALVKVGRRAIAQPATAFPTAPPSRRSFPQTPAVIAIAASTGGPLALSIVFKNLPRNFPIPIVVVQHMATGFTKGLSEWLRTESNLPITIANDSLSIEPGVIYLAPDDRHLVFARRGVLTTTQDLPVSYVRPSATVLFNSVAQFYGAEGVGVILTGMGSDGTLGIQAMHQKGALTIAQDELSSVVYGMPKAAVELGVIDQVLPLDSIASALMALAKT